MLLNDAPTVDKVTARLVDKLLGGGEEAEDHPASGVTGLARQHVEDIDAAMIEAVAEDARRLTETGTRLTA